VERADSDCRRAGFPASRLDQPRNRRLGRFVILLAGLAAVAAALASLLRLRSREVWFSQVFSYYSGELMPDIRARRDLPRKERHTLWLDSRLQKLGNHLGPPYFYWAVALMIFFAADIVAYAVTL
jgi:hypothetical protein